LWGEITAVDRQLGVGVVLQNWENRVANPTAKFKHRFSGGIGQLGELGEQPIPGLEESVLKRDENILNRVVAIFSNCSKISTC